MNPLLNKLQPYPFEKLRQLFADIMPASLTPISFGMGEPKHPTPQFIKDALINALSGLASYPSTVGSAELRQVLAAWLQARYQLTSVDAATEVLPVAGSREALFSLAQTVIDSSRPGALVICPNPFYQIYEGAALLAGAQPYFVTASAHHRFACDYTTVPAEVWARTQLLYLCSPGNPTGAVLSLEDWRRLFDYSERYGFVIAADECYSEIYFDDAQPPLGGLQAAHLLGRGFERLLVLSSLSKRSNVPGLRSGFVAGDAALLKQFIRYRTYHGCALNPAVQAASMAAWSDEAHVRENRAKYRRKFQAVMPLLAEVLDVQMPDAGFYLWARVDGLGVNDTEFAQRLFTEYNVTVLPGSYLGRDVGGVNPGRDYVRLALVAELDECLAGAQRIVEFCQGLKQI